MDSFYAGKPGVSFVLKGHFAYISPDKDTYQTALAELIAEGKTQDEAVTELKPQTMTECFSDVNYKDIWFNEFCIIDTKNKSDKDNGKVFRRTMKGPSDETHIGGVSEYIGQIVGPAGLAPLYEIADVATTHQLWEDTNVKSNDFIEYYGTDDQKHNTKSIEGVDLKTFETGKAGAINLVPGSTLDDTPSGYVDALKYNWYQFVEGGSEDGMPARIYVGMDFPYYEAEFFAGRAINYTEDPVLAKTLDKTFYDEYTLDVPRGITGGQFKDFQRITKTAAVYSVKGIIYDAPHDSYTFDKTKTVNNLNGKDIWIAYFYWNDPNGNEHKLNYPIYIGTISDIREISDIDENGTFTVYYTDNTSKEYTHALSWIKEVQFDDTNSVITITDNRAADEQNRIPGLPLEVNLKRINNIELIGDINLENVDDTRKIKVTYSDIDPITGRNRNQLIGDEINYIQEVYYHRPEDEIPEDISSDEVEAYHAYILFNAPSKRFPILQDSRTWKIIKPDLGAYWLDLGYMRQVDQGLLLKTRIITDVQTEAEALLILKQKYERGLEPPDEGKLVGVELASHDVFLAAYDYDAEEWFSVGTFQSATLDAIIDDPQVINPSKAGQTTVWFHIEGDKPEVGPMSTPWTYANAAKSGLSNVIKSSFITNKEGTEMTDVWDSEQDRTVSMIDQIWGD